MLESVKAIFVRSRGMWILLTSGSVFALDVWSKYLAETSFQNVGDSQYIFEWFSFTLVHNYGVAFGVLNNIPPELSKYLLLLLPVFIMILVWKSFGRSFSAESRLGAIVIGLIFGGAIGNVWDRMFDQRVTDFIDWHYTTNGKCLPLFYRLNDTLCGWPVFNFADCAITAAMILLLFHSLFYGNKDAEVKK